MRAAPIPACTCSQMCGLPMEEPCSLEHNIQRKILELINILAALSKATKVDAFNSLHDTKFESLTSEKCLGNSMIFTLQFFCTSEVCSCQPSRIGWTVLEFCPMSRLCPRLPDLVAVSQNTARLHKCGYGSNINLLYLPVLVCIS